MEHLFDDKNKGALIAASTVNEKLFADVLGDGIAAVVNKKEPLPADPFTPFEAKSKLRKVLENRGIQIAPIALCFGLAAGIYIPVFTELVKDRVSWMIFMKISTDMPKLFCRYAK